VKNRVLEGRLDAKSGPNSIAGGMSVLNARKTKV
jgi:hypothetical protein